MACKILIVDDSSVVRHSVRFWLEQNSDWRICGEAENGAVAVDQAQQLHPDVVILDLSMPVMNGLEAARRITRMSPRPAMVMLTMHVSKQLEREAAAAGVDRVVSKADHVLDNLAESIRAVIPSRPHMS